MLPLITKTYRCEVVSTLETMGNNYTRRVTLLNIQAIHAVLPTGTTMEPSSAQGRMLGDEVPVVVTCNQSGHDLLDHFGFEEVK